MRERSPNSFQLVAAIGILLLGIGLRVHGLASQLLISDEWHALFAASQFSYGELADMFTIGATSPPMNLLFRLFLDTVGWSETTLRVPGLVAGIGLIAALPLLIRSYVSDRVALVFAGLVAVSPILIYFSRYLRPYGFVVLLTWVALISALRFARGGGRASAYTFCLAAISLAYLHVLEVRIGVLCTVGLWGVYGYARFRGEPPLTSTTPSLRSLLVVTAVVIGMSGVLVALALGGDSDAISRVVQRAPIGLPTLVQASALLYGVGSPLALALVGGLSLFGAWWLLRHDGLLATFLGFVAVGSVGVLWLASPDGSHLPEIAARYLLPIMPVAWLALAAGTVESIARLARWLPIERGRALQSEYGALLLPAALLVTGPVPSDVLTTNQFTNHKSFHFDYSRNLSPGDRFARYLARSRRDAPRTLPIPEFYERLAKDPMAGPIVEYPIRIGDKWIPYSAYQQVHRKRVLGGFLSSEGPVRGLPHRGFLRASDSLDQFAAQVGAAAIAGLENIVDLDDADRLHDLDPAYLVVHLDIESEVLGQVPESTSLGRVDLFERRYGAPVHRDERIAVFRIASRTDAATDSRTSSAGGKQRRDRPNIVLAISDDHDYEHLGFAGGSADVTPSIDRLAAEGGTFPIAYTQPRCRPTLAGLLTGLPPHRSRIFFNFAPERYRGTRLLPDNVAVLPELLREAGYRTFVQGKFWEGAPRDFGFDAGPGWDDDFVRRDQRELFSFLENVGDEPFFVWWAPTLPHVPHNPPDRLRSRVEPDAIEVPNWIHSRDREAFVEAEATNLAMAAWLDEGFGALQAKLERESLTDNTLTVFLIDNGWANGFVSKGSPMEKGMRTPIVFHWPDRLESGLRISELVTHLDIMPTLLDFAAAEVPDGLPGRNLRPLLELREAPARKELIGAVYPAYWDGSSTPREAAVALYVRTRTMKYVYWLRDIEERANARSFRIKHLFLPFPSRERGDVELYDLTTDPDERVNLATSPAHAETRAELHERAMRWWERETRPRGGS